MDSYVVWCAVRECDQSKIRSHLMAISFYSNFSFALVLRACTRRQEEEVEVEVKNELYSTKATIWFYEYVYHVRVHVYHRIASCSSCAVLAIL